MREPKPTAGFGHRLGILVSERRPVNAAPLRAVSWVIQTLRQIDAQVFKKYSQMKLQMKREALDKLNRKRMLAQDHIRAQLVHSVHEKSAA